MMSLYHTAEDALNQTETAVTAQNLHSGQGEVTGGGKMTQDFMGEK